MTTSTGGTKGPDRSGPMAADSSRPLRDRRAHVHDDACTCRFDISPPRHFIYPALLLLLAEEPRHGYRLVDGLLHLGLGPVSRPSVYRALADLDADGLLESWSAEPTAGSTRHVYGLSPAGQLRLDEWMGTITAERDALDHVVKRFDILGDRDGPLAR